jgi:parallel beta-helix repeat protein
MPRTRSVFLWLAAVLIACAAASVARAQPGDGRPTLRVSNTQAAGPGSLAHAIDRANRLARGARIHFDLPAADPGHNRAQGTWTISLDKPLPPVTGGRVTIDGTSQPKLDGRAEQSELRIIIAATRPGVDHALALVSSKNEVRSVAVGRFEHGIALVGPGATGNLITDCCIGVGADGQTPAPNETGVVIVSGASRNTLADNVISGNASLGVYLGGKQTTGNVLRRNRIGSDASGSRRVPNAIGVMIARSSENIIGGSEAGDGNLIAGNDDIGLLLVGKWTERNAILGNQIGVDTTGTRILHNNIGIVIKSLANGNVVGGTGPAERNVISGNIEIGVYIEAADGNRIVGNLIGPDVTGTKSVTDGTLVQGNGVEFNTVAKDNVLGGKDPAERNVISGNKVYGVVYYGHCTRNRTVGNYIGVDATGRAPLPNATGICVDCASHHNDIARNVISGNLNYGLFFVTRGTEHNTLRGNLIGTNAAGTAALPNDIGMVVSTGASRNTIGGEEPGDRNVFSGNRQGGLMITNRFTEENRVIGNFIGVDATGSERLPNRYGVLMSTYPKANVLRGNVIAGNHSAGVILYEYAEANVLVSNFIGTDPSGKRVLGNLGGGVVLDQHARHNVIGRPGAGNRIAHNLHGGIIEQPKAGPGNRFAGNSFAANAGPEIARLRESEPAPKPTQREDTFHPLPPETEVPAAEHWPQTQPSQPPASLADAREWTRESDVGRYRVTFTVTTTSDAGPGSLRQAIQRCNQAGGSAAIRFNIPKSDPGFHPKTGTWTIAFRDTPPSLAVNHVRIDGHSQTKQHGDTNPNGPEIALDGNGHRIEYGLSLINASHVTIRGLLITRFVYGIQVYGRESHHNRVVGCFIGTNASGTQATGNYNGIEFLSGAHHNVVGGAAGGERNVVSGNEHIGIRISDANHNVIIGNHIGLDIRGLRAVPNYDGVCIEGRSRQNVIGGTRTAERNIISGNVAYGVDLFGWGVRENRIFGNYIGTDRTGTKPVPNTYGVLFDDRASKNVVGGLGEGEGNLISGNTAFGAYVYNNGTHSNVIRGNRIGTDASGTRPLPNETGVHIDGAARANVVDRNLISGNVVAGVTLFARHTDGNVITGNRIGTDIGGHRPLGNGADGVRIAFGPKRTLIGGRPDDANLIAFNGKNGIAVESEHATGNRISCNRIHGNAHLGIDLFPEGVNENDPGDTDGGPNAGMNRPTITAVTRENGKYRVSGTIDTGAPATLAVEVFIGTRMRKGHVQGATYLGTAQADAAGRWTLSAPGGPPACLAATATDRRGNTSEFASWPVDPRMP